MKKHRMELPCALLTVPRPGDRETRVRMAPKGALSRAEREI